MEKPSPPPGILHTCTSCGNPVGADQKFCEICGTKVEELPVCRKCGALFIAPVKFCELCGTAVIPDGSLEGHDEGPEPELPALHEADMVVPEGEDEREIPEPEPLPVTEQEPPEQEEPDPTPVPPPAKPPIPLSVDALFLQDEEGQPGHEGLSGKNKPLNKAFIAGGIILLLVVIAGIFFIGLPVLQGNTGLTGTTPSPAMADTALPEQTTLPATMPTMMPTTVPTTSADPFLPLPTQIIPKNQEVFFQVQKDPITAEITVIFAGGPGINSISSGEVKVTREDGAVLTGSIKPSKGDTELTLEGSKGSDRVEVIAKMYNGQTYRVYDDLLSYKAR